MVKHIAAAILFAILFYTGILPRPARARYAALVPRSSVTQITGTVISNPSKSSGGTGTYRFDFALESVRGNLSGANYPIQSQAEGVVSVLYPAKLLEAVLPGKLFSQSLNRTSLFIDSGIRLTLNGKATENFFIADGARYAEARNAGGQSIYSADFLPFARGFSRLVFKRVLYAWGNAGGLFLALVTGAREYTEESLSALFAAAGLAHILALSGMHLGIFTSFSSKIGKRAGSRAGNAISLLTVVLFVWFAGFTPSLRRAFLCFLINYCAKLCGKKTNMLSVLSLAFMVHVCALPSDAASLSFMLSYLGLAGILIAAITLQPLCARVLFVMRNLFHLPSAPPPRKIRIAARKVSAFIGSNASAGAGAFLATAPVTASAFGYLTPISVISSLCVSPLVTIFILAGIVCFVLTVIFPQFTFFLGKIINALYTIIIEIVTIFSRAPRVCP